MIALHCDDWMLVSEIYRGVSSHSILEILLIPSGRCTQYMTTAKFSQLSDLEEFSKASGIPSSRVLDYAESNNQSTHYQCFKIPKHGHQRVGEYRVVYKAKKEWLSQLHRAISMIVQNSFEFGEHVQGFIQKRSIRTNANLHLGAKKLLHADITNFFDSITREQVQVALIAIGSPIPLAEIIAKASTINGLLRQGTRCSPAIANLVCRCLDMEFITLASSTGSVYSRYADDITFSGDNTPSPESIDFILKMNGFQLRDGRCYLQSRGKSQFVTGLSIADETASRLPKRLKRRLRLILYYIDKFGVEAHFSHKSYLQVASNSNQLFGMLSFVNSIEPKLANKLLSKLP